MSPVVNLVQERERPRNLKDKTKVQEDDAVTLFWKGPVICATVNVDFQVIKKPEVGVGAPAASGLLNLEPPPKGSPFILLFAISGVCKT